MQLDRYVTTLGKHLKARFGERVRKLSLHAGFSCPNRDGSLGRGGCSFCSVRSFSHADPRVAIGAQLSLRKAEIKRAARYLAYFQAYTSTYAEIEDLRQLYEEATAHADIIGLCVGTRPDCVPDAVLEMLAGYRQRGYEVWLELGLQSADDATLARINRGHGFAAYADAVARARLHQIPVCAHLIVGLPGETAAASLATHQRVLQLGVQGIKLHPLMIVKGSQLAAEHARQGVDTLALEEYAATAAELIRRTPTEVVFHRVSATSRTPTLIAPHWCYTSWPANNAICRDLAQHGAQGSRVQSCGGELVRS